MQIKKAHPTVKARMAARAADPREQPAERELARRIMAAGAADLAFFIEMSGRISRGEMTAVQALAELYAKEGEG
jgi:hypothetical protein